MEHKQPLVSIIVLNWNGLEDTISCVSSLLHQAYQNFRIYIVDNASANNEASKLSRNFSSEPRVTVIANNKNDGYAGGNNVGLRSADEASSYFWIVNNDTTAEIHALSALVQLAESSEHVGMVGSTILYPDKKTIYALGGGSFNAWTGVDRLSHSHAIWNSQTVQEHHLDFISGASLLLSKKAYDHTNGFDEDYFLYSEEADLAYRCLQNGFSLYYAPASIIYHQSAKTTQYWSATYIYYFLRGKLIYLQKNVPLWKRPIWIMSIIAYYGFGFIILGALKKRYTGKFVWRAFQDAFTNKWGAQPNRAQL